MLRKVLYYKNFSLGCGNENAKKTQVSRMEKPLLLGMAHTPLGSVRSSVCSLVRCSFLTKPR